MTPWRPAWKLVPLLALSVAGVLLPTTPAAAWSDVPGDHWARDAIDYVALTHDWMQDFGPDAFHPDAIETRRYLARAVVKAFAPAEPVDPAVAFTDLPPDDPFYPYANVAVKLGLMASPGRSFRPDRPVTTVALHRALVYALGLRREARGLDGIHTSDGRTFPHRNGMGALALGMLLGLRFNHSDEALEVGPRSELSRAEVAWSLYRAATVPPWKTAALAPYRSVDLGVLTEGEREVVQFALDYVGYPYVWGGEWHRASPTRYCCGNQPVGGFDCSGLMWWVVKAPAGGYDNTVIRPYAGWALPERTSRDMAAQGEPLAFEEIRFGDLLFFDTGGNDGRVDHVSLYLGNGWALDAASGYAGSTIIRVGEGWWRDHFLWARRIMGGESTPAGE